jgi:uncharacterized protein YkwD
MKIDRFRSRLAAILLTLTAGAWLWLPARLPAEPEDTTSRGWTEADYTAVTPGDFRRHPLFLEEIDFTAIDYPRLHAAVFYATNEIRVKYKLAELEYAPQLERSSLGHARRMVEQKFFSHTDRTDRRRVDPNARGRLAGIANPFVAENIADAFGITYRPGRNIFPRPGEPGSFSYTATGPLIPPHTYLSFADAVLEIWMNSAGHRANILSKNALQLGCGAYFYRDPGFYRIARFKAVQNFQWYRKIAPGMGRN